MMTMTTIRMMVAVYMCTITKLQSLFLDFKGLRPLSSVNFVLYLQDKMRTILIRRPTKLKVHLNCTTER